MTNIGDPDPPGWVSSCSAPTPRRWSGSARRSPTSRRAAAQRAASAWARTSRRSGASHPRARPPASSPGSRRRVRSRSSCRWTSPGPSGIDAADRSRTAQAPEPLAELEHARLPPGADVEARRRASAAAAATSAPTTSPTKMKSRVCSPSPKTIGGSPLDEAPREDRDHAGLAVGVLARAVDVASRRATVEMP